MNLTKGTWHYNFWKINFDGSYNYSQEPNNNFCDYFWKLVLAIIFIPFTWIGLIIKKRFKTSFSFESLMLATILGYICIFVGYLLGIIIYHHSLKSLIILGSIVGIGILIFAVLYFSIEYYPNSKLKDNLLESGNIIKEGISSFKNKYCPKISWKEKI